VRVQAQVVLRRGALEFFACFPGKEHESILRIDAAAEHVYQALGLIGLTPGHPPVWNAAKEEYEPPTGDLIDVAVEWEEQGRLRSADASCWLREIEYGRMPFPRPWVFGGSVRLEDNSLAAGRSGVGIAVVDFPDCLLCFSRRYSSRQAELWAEANTEAIPPTQTAVWLLLRPAAPRELRVALTPLGVFELNGRFCTPDDLADLVGLARQMDSTYVQIVHAGRVLRTDVQAARAALCGAGIAAEAVRFVYEGAAD